MVRADFLRRQQRLDEALAQATSAAALLEQQLGAMAVDLGDAKLWYVTRQKALTFCNALTHLHSLAEIYIDRREADRARECAESARAIFDHAQFAADHYKQEAVQRVLAQLNAPAK